MFGKTVVEFAGLLSYHLFPAHVRFGGILNPRFGEIKIYDWDRALALQRYVKLGLLKVLFLYSSHSFQLPRFPCQLNINTSIKLR